MKSLKESLINNIDPQLDDQSVLDAETLYGCMKNHIKNFGFKRTMGPTHFPKVVEANKRIKRKYKPVPLKSNLGLKANPALLADIVFAIAPEVKINYKLSVEERIKDALKQFDKIYDEAIGTDGEAGGLNIYFDAFPITKRYIDGVPSYSTKKGIGLTIEIDYSLADGGGEMKINIDDQSPLFRD